MAFTEFINRFTSLYDKYFPVLTKEIKKKTLLKPWVSETLVKRIKMRDKLAKLSNKGRIDREIFTQYRNSLNSQLRNAKTSYFQYEFSKCEGNIKKTWEIINHNIRKNRKSNNISLQVNNKEISKESVPNEFIEYFSNIASLLVSDIAPSNYNASYYLKNKNPNTFFMAPILSNEIEKCITSLKSSGSAFSISSAVLENVKGIISDALAHIFNLCIEQGYFPCELKVGRITPIHKKGNKNLVINYRPVCNLSPFSKIFERIIYDRMLEYLNRFNIISSTQYGFRKEMGTETALIDFTNFIHTGLTKKHHVGAIFMDLSKAFDVMDHKILEIKLEHYGFRGKFLEFIMSFLRERKYFVHVNGLASETKTVDIGVPQGSTLGPLLFLIFINDMKNCSEFLKFIQFADDTTTMYSSNDIDQLNEILGTETNKVVKWLNANKLIINLGKTKCMLFSNKRNNPQLKILLDDKYLDVETETTFLGVLIDNKLTWRAHINHISSKISKSIAILRMFRQSFPKEILRKIYMSLIFSHINYCNLIWGSANVISLNPLIRLQKKAIRLVNNSNYTDHTAPIFKSMKILTVHQIFKLNCLSFIYNCIRTDKFPTFKKMLIKNVNIHSHHTRQANNYRPQRERLELCKRSYFSQGIVLWNSLEPSIQHCSTIDIFKHNIKNLLMQSI